MWQQQTTERGGVGGVTLVDMGWGDVWGTWGARWTGGGELYVASSNLHLAHTCIQLTFVTTGLLMLCFLLLQMAAINMRTTQHSP